MTTKHSAFPVASSVGHERNGVPNEQADVCHFIGSEIPSNDAIKAARLRVQMLRTERAILSHKLAIECVSLERMKLEIAVGRVTR
jgi:hypothetical protein